METLRPIYFDHGATTPVDPEVLIALLPFMNEQFGNPSSRDHGYGQESSRAIEEARERIGAAVGARPDQVLFTSGATESNNLAILGTARACDGGRTNVVTVRTEHPAVLEPCTALEQEGFSVVRIAVDRRGKVDLDELSEAVDTSTALVSVMLANNEVGTIQPLAEIGRIARRVGAIVHCDAAQAFGKVPIDLEELKIDLLSVSAHKVYGPKGVGALCFRKTADGNEPQAPFLQAIMHGGGQEKGLRPGTPNVPGIVGIGRAAQIAVSVRREETRRVERFRDRLEAILEGALEGVTVRGDRSPGGRLSNLSCVTIDGVHSDALMVATPQVAFSSGSACASGSQEPSHVLTAMGMTPAEARSTVRFGLGRFTTEEEVDRAGQWVVAAAKRLRELGFGGSSTSRRT